MKQAWDMQQRFKIDETGLDGAIRQVTQGCSVCQACNPHNHIVEKQLQWMLISDKLMESKPTDVFSMPKLHIGKEGFNRVALCVDKHSGYIVAVPARNNALLAKEVVVGMVRN